MSPLITLSLGQMTGIHFPNFHNMPSGHRWELVVSFYPQLCIGAEAREIQLGSSCSRDGPVQVSSPTL
ncbi:hypothetical protein TNCV_112711 [Trichonephila clavipes]|nr:hypothetical protein TNCV_112711 [Trichonephila clavipes]